MPNPTRRRASASPGRPAMSRLVLGPLLRHVGATDATIWVETRDAAEVEIRAGAAVGRDRTFRVAGHHYAIVVVDGLEAGTETPYEVRLDGELVWPEPGTEPAGDVDTANAAGRASRSSARPPSAIRTLHPNSPIR